jgi:hypothetical protein
VDQALAREQTAWRALLDPGRFYDREKKIVINLPENYFGVAARIATMDFQMGLITDRAFADDLLERAAGQFLKGALYTDDALPNGASIATRRSTRASCSRPPATSGARTSRPRWCPA